MWNLQMLEIYIYFNDLTVTTQCASFGCR